MAFPKIMDKRQPVLAIQSALDEIDRRHGERRSGVGCRDRYMTAAELEARLIGDVTLTPVPEDDRR